MNTIFKEIRYDHIDDNNVLHIDGWRSEDDNAEGEVIGYFIKGEVYYRDPELQFDPYVQDVVKELKSNYKPEGKPKIVVVVEGGIIQTILTNNPDTEITIIDYDLDQTDSVDNLVDIPQGEGKIEKAYLYEGVQPEVNPERVEEIFNLKQ